MKVQSNALRSRLQRLSYRLSATRLEPFYSNPNYPIPCRRGSATPFSSNARNDTILQDSGHAPACKCWSLLATSSSDIISNIPTLKIQKAKITSWKTPLVVLLVTPAHIGLLDNHSATFIPSLLQLAVENPKSCQHFDLLAAVVDRIPIPQKASAGLHTSRGSHAVDVDSSSPKIRVEDGFEGISFAVLDSEAAAPDLWSPRDPSNEREPMTIQQRCTLSFSLPPNPGVRTQFSHKSASQPLVKRMLQLPVANTLFQNGRTSTLFAQRWEISSRSESTPEYMSSKKIWLPRQTIDMGAIFTDEGMRLKLDHFVHSYLVPITPARTITAAVGNIVRKISGEDSSAEAAPASEELERAISTAIQQGQIPAQQAGVWALIRPQKYAALNQTAQPGRPVRDIIEYAILSGARLHKVLSGGGGWGEKHGLLALDPDSDYNHHHRAFEPSFGDDQDLEAKKREALGAVAKSGDSITFYVYRSLCDTNPAYLHTYVSRNSSQAATATLTFGSLPSTVDAMPEFDIAETHTQSELKVEENHFGMLSEQGMSLESSFLNTNVTANRMQFLRTELNRQFYKVRSSNKVTTKLDAPYTLLSIRGQASRITVSSEIKGEELRAFNVNLQSLMPPEPSTATGTTKSAATLVQKLPNENDPKQEASPLNKSSQVDREPAKSEGRKEEESSKLTLKKQPAKELKTSETQSRTAKERNQRVAKEATVISERHPGISGKAAMKKVANEREQGNYKSHELDNRRVQEVKSERSMGLKTLMMHQNNRTTLTVRSTSQEQEPYHKATVQPEAQDAPPIAVRRHFSVRSGDFYQTRRVALGQKFDVRCFRESKSSPGNVKYENKPDSFRVTRVESRGQKPGKANEGKDGNLFRLRKHPSIKFERFEEFEKQIGEITSRERAIEYSQYHLALEKQQEEVRNI